MAAIIAAFLQFIPLVPGIVSNIEQLIARGKANGELSPAEADALTALATSIFDKYKNAPPPPPGV